MRILFPLELLVVCCCIAEQWNPTRPSPQTATWGLFKLSVFTSSPVCRAAIKQSNAASTTCRHTTVQAPALRPSFPPAVTMPNGWLVNKVAGVRPPELSSSTIIGFSAGHGFYWVCLPFTGIVLSFHHGVNRPPGIPPGE